MNEQRLVRGVWPWPASEGLDEVYLLVDMERFRAEARRAQAVLATHDFIEDVGIDGPFELLGEEQTDSDDEGVPLAGLIIDDDVREMADHLDFVDGRLFPMRGSSLTLRVAKGEAWFEFAEKHGDHEGWARFSAPLAELLEAPA